MKIGDRVQTAMGRSGTVAALVRGDAVALLGGVDRPAHVLVDFDNGGRESMSPNDLEMMPGAIARAKEMQLQDRMDIARVRRVRSDAYRRCAALIRNVGPPSAAFLADTIETWAVGGQ